MDSLRDTSISLVQYSLASSSHYKHDSAVLCSLSPCGQTISLFNAPMPTLQYEGEGCGGEEEICEIDWENIVWNTATRKLVNQSHAHFMKLQEESERDIKMSSRRYRSALHECALELKKLSECMGEDDSTLQDQSDLYSMLEVVWHLCEIQFIEVLPPGCLIQQLLEWVCYHEHYVNEKLKRLLASPPIEDNEDYMMVVIRLLLQGRGTEVAQLLLNSSYCSKNVEVYSSIKELLVGMPMVQPTAGRSRVELRSVCYAWKRECQKRRERGDYDGSPELLLISGILCGDESCFKHESVVESCMHWYELMVGRLLYCSPLVINSDYELQYMAEECLSLFDHDLQNLGALDQLLLKAFQYNILDVIKLSSSVLSNWWFAAHLSNLLHCGGMLVSDHLEYGSKLTEFILTEYASSLMAHPSLWQIAMNYLSHCPFQGREYMSCFIERVQLTSDWKALKVLSVCKQYDLNHQAQGICRVMAMREYRCKRLGAALVWCIRAKDSSFSAFIAEKYFDLYQNLGEFKDLDMLNHLGSAMLLSPQLSFLGKYREFHVQYGNGDFRSAAELLISLLSSGIVPKKYKITLITDALPLLELKDQVVFSTTETKILLHVVLDINKGPAVEDNVKLIQLALLRNLRRATLENHW